MSRRRFYNLDYCKFRSMMNICRKLILNNLTFLMILTAECGQITSSAIRVISN